MLQYLYVDLFGWGFFVAFNWGRENIRDFKKGPSGRHFSQNASFAKESPPMNSPGFGIHLKDCCISF